MRKRFLQTAALLTLLLKNVSAAPPKLPEKGTGDCGHCLTAEENEKLNKITPAEPAPVSLEELVADSDLVIVGTLQHKKRGPIGIVTVHEVLWGVKENVGDGVGINWCSSPNASDADGQKMIWIIKYGSDPERRWFIDLDKKEEVVTLLAARKQKLEAQRQKEKAAKDPRASTEKPACPVCRSPDHVIPILYGQEDLEMREKFEKGEVALGGCLHPPNPPQWKCKKCGKSW